MAVAFGTPVIVNFGAHSSYGLVMSGVTSGQPIIVCAMNVQINTAITGISDNFSTPYTWTKVQSLQVTGDKSVELWIGTGGVGTSGTITVTEPSSMNTGGWASACTGASIAAGLAALNSSAQSSGSASTTASSVSLTPYIAGCGAVYAIDNGGDATFSSVPGSPWVDSSIGSYNMRVDTYVSPTANSALTTTWTQSGSVTYATVGLIVLPLGYTSKTFAYTGALENWTVPTKVHGLHAIVNGGDGIAGATAGTVGKSIIGDYAVSPGDSIVGYVGSLGNAGNFGLGLGGVRAGGSSGFKIGATIQCEAGGGGGGGGAGGAHHSNSGNPGGGGSGGTHDPASDGNAASGQTKGGNSYGFPIFATDGVGTTPGVGENYSGSSGGVGGAGASVAGTGGAAGTAGGLGGHSTAPGSAGSAGSAGSNATLAGGGGSQGTNDPGIPSYGNGGAGGATNDNGTNGTNGTAGTAGGFTDGIGTSVTHGTNGLGVGSVIFIYTQSGAAFSQALLSF